MHRIVDWYWEHGVRRKGKWTIPPSWIDSIMKLAEKDLAIEQFQSANSRKKPCFALWGQSQSGKSTLLADYIDGNLPDGSDSALSWNGVNTRFTATGEVPEQTLVFNPYNSGSDASGLVTRFFLADETEIRPEYPVRIKLAARKQILHALTIGYLSECSNAPAMPVTRDEIFAVISGIEPERTTVSRDAFELLREVCDVMEIMGGEYPRFSIFNAGNRGGSLRTEILSSGRILSGIRPAQEFVFRLLWNSHAKLKDLYLNLMRQHAELSERFGERPVYASMRAAIVFEDIASLQIYSRQEANARATALRRTIDNLRFKITSDAVLIGENLAGDAMPIGAEKFGRFQALIGEMNVPLKREALVKNRKAAFLEFLEKSDILDFPGVTNRPLGNAAVAENQIDLNQSRLDDTALLTGLYKSGKTLSIIYSQLGNLAIDSFSISVNLEHLHIRRPQTLTSGVTGWLRMFQPEWTCNDPAPLGLYVNLTCFGGKIRGIATGGIGTGLGSLVEMVKSLPFARKNVAEFFITNTRFFPLNGQSQAVLKQVREAIAGDVAFADAFLAGAQDPSLAALFADGLGTDYMFRTIGAKISLAPRERLYLAIRTRDCRILLEALNDHLPQEAAALREERLALLGVVINNLVMARKRCGENCRKLAQLSLLIKEIFFIEADILDPLPVNLARMPDEEVRTFVTRQLSIWVENRHCRLTVYDGLEQLMPAAKVRMFLEITASIAIDDVVAYLKRIFTLNLSDSDAHHAKRYLALVLSNQLFYGRVERSDTAQDLFEQFARNLRSLTDAPVNPDRPEQDGDAELRLIRDEIESKHDLGGRL